MSKLDELYDAINKLKELGEYSCPKCTIYS